MMSANFLLDNIEDFAAIRRKLNSTKCIYLPFLTRRHWSLLALDSNSRCASHWDSAPSPAVRRDVRKFVTSLFPGWTVSPVVTCRQLRDSAECGLFTIAFALCIADGMQTLCPGRFVSLKHWFTHVRKRDTSASLQFFRDDLRQLRQRFCSSTSATSPQRSGGGETGRLHINVDDTPELESAISTVRQHDDLLRDALAAEQGAMLTSTNLDALILLIRQLAGTQAEKRVVLTTVEQNIPQSDFMRPMFTGPAEAGHFTLLVVCGDSATIVDSLPTYRPNDSWNLALRLLLKRPELHRNLKRQTVTQRSNECGYVVAEQVAQRLGLERHDRPRDFWAPKLTALRRDQLQAATAKLEAMKTEIARIVAPTTTPLSHPYSSDSDEDADDADDIPIGAPGSRWYEDEAKAVQTKQENVAAPTAGTTPEEVAEPAVCCRREKSVSGFCAWHHPLVAEHRDRPLCSSTNAVGKPCRELQLGLGGIHTCWYHSDQASRLLFDQSILGTAPARVPTKFAVGEMAPLKHGVVTLTSQTVADAAKHWRVFEGRPPHVHQLTWNNLSKGTRKSHASWVLVRHVRTLMISKGSVGSNNCLLVISLCSSFRYAKEG